MFADDTKLYSWITQPGDKDCLQRNIIEACRWAAKWQMPFNVITCKIMHIGKSEPNEYYIKEMKATHTKLNKLTKRKTWELYLIKI